MRVAFLASEAIPYAKTGGLADVAGALPKFLSPLGADVRVFMPYYREVRKKGLPLGPAVARGGFEWGGRTAEYAVLEHRADGFLVDFIVQDAYFDRDALYGTPAGDYPDNGERFAFFARASLEAMKALGFTPDVVHGHDWQAATAFAYLKFVYGGDPFFKNARSVFTVHNLAYQGQFEPDVLSAVGLPDSLYSMNDLEFYGKVNFLKAGILYASAVTTVSPRYSREIQTPEFGCGMDGLLRARSGALSGILNGVDYADWDPATDRLIPANFTPRDLTGKALSKAGLLGTFGLEGALETPVAGMVTRLAAQKGVDIVCEALEEVFALGLTVVILGTGDQKIQDFLKGAAKKSPGRLGLKIAFDEKVAHTIYAGSDLFLIPSRYEPCGLTQMYALKYGTVPVVRATGGLEDTIQEFDPTARTGNGFKFREAEPEALLASLRRTLAVYARPMLWRGLVRNGMAADHSWSRSAGEYLALYRKVSGRPEA
ncbi:MAG TPA: glycogen synthase GlgA [Terriglobales bacterium]|nr:glycogen synthase GlgA [Terriglobales bacterium]